MKLIHYNGSKLEYRDKIIYKPAFNLMLPQNQLNFSFVSELTNAPFVLDADPTKVTGWVQDYIDSDKKAITFEGTDTLYLVGHGLVVNNYLALSGNLPSGLSRKIYVVHTVVDANRIKLKEVGSSSIITFSGLYTDCYIHLNPAVETTLANKPGLNQKSSGHIGIKGLLSTSKLTFRSKAVKTVYAVFKNNQPLNSLAVLATDQTINNYFIFAARQPSGTTYGLYETGSGQPATTWNNFIQGYIITNGVKSNTPVLNTFYTQAGVENISGFFSNNSSSSLNCLLGIGASYMELYALIGYGDLHNSYTASLIMSMLQQKYAINY